MIGWLGTAEAQTNHDAEHAPAGVLARLHGQLGTLLTRFGELSDEAWRSPVTANGWTPAQVICHLRDLEAEAHLPRLQLMLQVKAAFLPAVDSDPWVDEREYAAPVRSAGAARLRRAAQGNARPAGRA